MFYSFLLLVIFLLEYVLMDLGIRYFWLAILCLSSYSLSFLSSYFIFYRFFMLNFKLNFGMPCYVWLSFVYLFFLSTLFFIYSYAEFLYIS
jgi:hypothetical protein